jgi:hypothetical protein
MTIRRGTHCAIPLRDVSVVVGVSVILACAKCALVSTLKNNNRPINKSLSGLRETCVVATSHWIINCIFRENYASTEM